MNLINADLFSGDEDWLLFTANSTLNSRGELVAGKGAALAVKQKYPAIPFAIGQNILQTCGNLGTYGVAIPYHSLMPVYDRQIGAFQTKRYWNDKAELSLVAYSTKCLIDLIEEGIHDLSVYTTVALKYPAVGLGGLSVKDVYPIINVLPDTVNIYCDNKTWDELKKVGII